MTRDPLAARLLSAFLSELGEQLRVLESELLALEARPGDAEILKTIFRVAHTLKGAARAANVPLVETTFHVLETLLSAARAGDLEIGEGHFELLFATLDAVTDARERIQADRSLEDSPLARLQPALSAGMLPPQEIRDTAPQDEAFDPSPETVPPETTSAVTPMQPFSPPPADGDRIRDQVRIDTEKLDALLGTAGELLLLVRRVSSRYSRLQELQHVASRRSLEWTAARRRMRRLLDRADPVVAVPRSIEETEEQIERLLQDTAKFATDSMEDSRRLSQLADSLGEGVRRVRMRPFREACEALPRAVRDLERTAGKSVNFRVDGAEVELGGAVLNLLRDAILHLVRNAVDHGIESPQIRQSAGKASTGNVTVAAALARGHVRVTVSDDGSGLNAAAIRELLRGRGIEVPNDKAELGRTLLQSPVSTSTDVTKVSGRGVGLDAVRSSLERIGGTVTVDWEEGEGTVFTLECPPTLTSVRALLARIGAEIVAIPTADVDRLVRLRLEELLRVEGRTVVAGEAAPVNVISLPKLLGPPLPDLASSDGLYGIQLLSGNQRLMIAVDRLLSEEEIVVRPPERVRKMPPFISGLALLPTGEVALVLNVAAVVAAGSMSANSPGVALEITPVQQSRKKRVLVVDDSITTRTLEQGILEGAGYEVVTAVDGMDGIGVLRDRPCDLVLSDVEMPRMDGFALCETIRRTPGLERLPIVLVTALEAPEHRARGLEVGADAYITKSSFDQGSLIDVIQQLLGEAEK